MKDELLIENKTGIYNLACLVGIRDPETGNHLRRTQGYIYALAIQLKGHPHFVDFLTDQNIQALVKSAPLHDIGKIRIPAHILFKPDKLTIEEWEIMKTHSKLGFDAIEKAEHGTDYPLEFLKIAKDIAHYHHEKWDGSGYPEGLAGEAIPIPARLMALADVFDALITKRIYKAPFPFQQAVAIIYEGRNNHFDPAIVDAFLAGLQEFEAVSVRHADSAVDRLG
jgi:putative two-component system response regulator